MHFFNSALGLAAGFQEFQGGVVGALEVGLVAVKAGKDAGLVVEGAECECGAGCGVIAFGFIAAVAFSAADFDFDEGGLDGFGADEAPACGDESIDEEDIDQGRGPEVEEVDFAEGAEVVFGFVFEDDLAGGEAVGDGGGGAAGEALGGDGSAGPGAVGARGIDATLGRHVVRPTWRERSARRCGWRGLASVSG
ncbi:MAG: hypothetical protein ABSH46_09245 [Bryobacteraceae bacterium]